MTPTPAPITAIGFAEKVVFAIASIDRVRMVTALLHSDHEKRMIGKAAFLFVDSGISHLRRLNNLVPGGTKLKRQLNATADDYEEHFSTVRDRLTAHRQEQPALDELRDWRLIQDDYIAYLRADMAELYELIRQRDLSLPSIAAVAPLTGDQSKAIIDATRPPAGFFIDMSAQALASSYTTTAILSGPAARGQDVIAIADTIRVLSQVYFVLQSAPDWQRLIRSLYVGEAINLFDVLFDDQNPDATHRQTSFAEALPELGNHASSAISILSTEAAALPTAVRSRDLRNRIAAHIDDSLPLSTLLGMIDSYDWSVLGTAVEDSLAAFSSACYSTMLLRSLLTHRKVMNGVVGLEVIDPAPPFSM